jgi:hypothetical protein
LIHAYRGLFLVRSVNGAVAVEPVGGADIGDVRGMNDLPGAGLLIDAEKGLFLARSMNGTATVEPVGGADTGRVDDVRDLSGLGLLIHAEKGLFLVRSVNGAASLEPAGKADTGRLSGMTDLPGVGELIGAEKGWLLVRSVNGAAVVEPVGGADPGLVFNVRDLPGAGLLIDAENGWFLARSVNGAVAVEPAGKADTGRLYDMRDLPGAGLLIDAEKGLFLARSTNGTATVEPYSKADTGSVYEMRDLPGVGLLIKAAKGLFLARAMNGTVTVEPFGKADTGGVSDMRELAGEGLLINAENGLFLARSINGTATVEPFGRTDTGRVNDMGDLPGVGLLIWADEGLFLVRSVNGTAVIEPFGKADTGRVEGWLNFPGAGPLIRTEKGWFLAGSVNGAATLEPAGKADMGTVYEGGAYEMSNLPGAGLLIQAENNGVFLARSVNGAASVEPVGRADLGFIHDVRDLPGVGLLIRTDQGLYLGVGTPLIRAKVELRDRATLDHSPPRPDSELFFVFTISAHACTSVADKLDLRLSVTPPGGVPIEPKPALELIHLDNGRSTFGLPLRIDKAGVWSFQVMSTSGGIERPVGEPEKLTFTTVGLRDWLEQWAWWMAGGLATILALANAAMFLFARRSAWAWRVATDDGLGTWTLRLATLALSHLPKAQLWILDLYFHRRRAKTPTVPPFLPLPLTSGDGAPTSSDKALAPPWTGKRLWVQGNSGMGKTALFHHVTEAHFRDHETAFSAFAKWGCVVVPFAARDFAGSGEDKDDPAWVIDAVRATLSSRGMTFADETMLSRFIESGSIGVGIDGLNEVNRTLAVTAFIRKFEAAPVLVTSQQSGDQRYFSSWRLPADIRAFTADLLEKYLGGDAATTVMTRISASGLKDAIRSGYDVRLIIDLARPDPQHAPLPADRLGLSAAVIDAAWPEVSEETRREQLGRLAAAAWRMVSERESNDDKRRLKPDEDLAADLLSILADVREKDGKPLALIRRVAGGNYEFVHDQMHAYLAARWFTQDGFSIKELEKMIEASTIWTHAIEERRTLWGFAAALLDDERLTALWARVENNEDWDSLRRALKAEADRRVIKQPDLHA